MASHGMEAPLPPVRVRPRRIRVVAWLAAAVVLLAAIGLAAALSGRIGDTPAAFGSADRVGLVGLGLIGALALLALTRPLVTADLERVRVRNIVGGIELPWSAVAAVRFDRGSSWATLELADGDVVGVLAIQAVDKQHAVAAVRALRDRHAAYQRAHRPRGGTGHPNG